MFSGESRNSQNHSLCSTRNYARSNLRLQLCNFSSAFRKSTKFCFLVLLHSTNDGNVAPRPHLEVSRVAAMILLILIIEQTGG